MRRPANRPEPAPLRDTVERAIDQHRLIRYDQPVLVAVSGGVDSMVLLHLLHALAPQRRWRLGVAHLNHQLRGRSSNADERLVVRTAHHLGLQCYTEKADVRRLAENARLSLEMAARQARHQFLARAARRHGFGTIALAHHADDQVELFFIRLLRGSGARGLSGMEWSSHSPVNKDLNVIRPLLGCPKAILEQYAEAEAIPFRTDASNLQNEFLRNRIRNELIPTLAAHQPGLQDVIRRVMELLRAEAELSESIAARWLEVHRPSRLPPSLTIAQGAGRLWPGSSALRALAFDALPLAVQRRCIQLQLIELGVVPDFDLIESLRSRPNHPLSCPKSAALQRGRETRCPSVLRSSGGLLQLESSSRPEFISESLLVELSTNPGTASFSGRNFSWSFTRGRGRPQKQVPGAEVFDAGLVGPTVLLRHWLPGDRFQPIGHPRPVKLQDFFTNQKVPRALRHRLVLAVSVTTGEVFWVEGQRIAERFKLTRTTRQVLNWRWDSP